jgi:hypothetical protein
VLTFLQRSEALVVYPLCKFNAVFHLRGHVGLCGIYVSLGLLKRFIPLCRAYLLDEPGIVIDILDTPAQHLRLLYAHSSSAHLHYFFFYLVHISIVAVVVSV